MAESRNFEFVERGEAIVSAPDLFLRYGNLSSQFEIGLVVVVWQTGEPRSEAEISNVCIIFVHDKSLRAKAENSDREKDCVQLTSCPYQLRLGCLKERKLGCMERCS